MATASTVRQIGTLLNDDKAPLKDRFRALFTLRNLGGNDSVEEIAACFKDDSALLKHELAYCLGQMQNPYALPYLVKVLEDKSQDAMVRHEAGEALGAIGDESAIEILKKYVSDPTIEVAETCQLALKRLHWLSEPSRENEDVPANPFFSVDPAPPTSVADVDELKAVLLDESKDLFLRYRAMFTLRNLSTEPAILALGEGLKCKSALFRHEIAYVLGQIQNATSVPQLTVNLEDHKEKAMVRHECAEALGSIATPEATEVLHKYLHDTERIVRESCVVALDMSEHANSDSFQYADTLAKMSALQQGVKSVES